MSAPIDGGPAFPCAVQIGKRDEVDIEGRSVAPDVPIFDHFSGMSLRDYFAAAALTGFMMQQDDRAFPGANKQENLDAIRTWRAAILAADCEYIFGVADAMLAERAKGNQ